METPLDSNVVYSIVHFALISEDEYDVGENSNMKKNENLPFSNRQVWDMTQKIAEELRAGTFNINKITKDTAMIYIAALLQLTTEKKLSQIRLFAKKAL